MTYRDERDALRARVEQLQQDLASARADAHNAGEEEGRRRAAALEQDLTKLRGELARVERELAALREGRRLPAMDGLLAALALTVVVGGAAAIVVLRAAPPPPPPPPPRPPAPESQETREDPPPPPPPRPATLEPPSSPPRVSLETREVRARFRGAVKRAEGLLLAPGTPCSIEAQIRARGTNAVVPELVVRCGKEKVYDSRDKLEGMAKRDNDARERLGPRDGVGVFTLQYNDLGTRTGALAQVDLDSTKREGVAFHEVLPRYRVEFSMSPQSEPGPPLTARADRLRREGRVVQATGAAPAKVGARCVLRAIPTGHGEHCIAEVACSRVILLPQATPVRCSYEGVRPIQVEGTGSPSLELSGDRLVLEKGEAWSIGVDLDSPAGSPPAP